MFIANQQIVRRGEYFSELYCIFKGVVIVSLRRKDSNEFFQLYQTNYFGDYQILLGLRSTECYKAGPSVSTFCHCLSKNDILDLVKTFPDAKHIFVSRAVERRVEFRRIRRIFELEANIHPDPEIDALHIDSKYYKIIEYNDRAEFNLPPFLSQVDYYFSMDCFMRSIPKEELAEISDSEIMTK